MAEIHKSATIEGSVERVFDFVDDPGKIPSYTPNVERVADVVRSEKRVGDTFRIIYKVMGVTFDEKFKVTDYERPNRVRFTFEGGMTGTFAYTFENEAGRTRVNVDVDYELAGGPLGKAIDAAVLHRTNEKTIEKQLQNLQTAIATGAVPGR